MISLLDLNTENIINKLEGSDFFSLYSKGNLMRGEECNNTF